MTNLMTKLHLLFIASRPISWINTAYPFAAGYLLTERKVDLVLIVGSLFFLIPYNLLMYGINDVFDYESDIRNPRKGGVEGAVIQKPMHRFVVLSALGLSLPFVIFLAFVSNGFAGLLMLFAVVFFVLAYSVPGLRFKEKPFLDSATSACHFVGPLVYALSFTHFTATELIIIASFFLWGMASHAFGAVQDILADREGGLASIATVIGARATARLAIVLYGTSALLLIHFGWLGMLVAATELLYVAMVWPYRNLSDKDAELSNKGWKKFIRLNQFAGFIVTIVLIYVFKTN